VMPRAAVVLAAEEEVLGEGLHRGDAAIEPQIGWRAVTAVVDGGAGELAGRWSQRRKPEVLGREPAALDGSHTTPPGSEISAQELGRPGDVRAAVFEPSTAQELTEPEARWARLTDRTSGVHEDGQLAEDSSAMTQQDVLERLQLDRAQSRRGGSEAPQGDVAGIDARGPLDLGAGRLGWARAANPARAAALRWTAQDASCSEQARTHEEPTAIPAEFLIGVSVLGDSWLWVYIPRRLSVGREPSATSSS
jgi:hypothetical protein